MAFFLQTVMGGLRLPLKADARIAQCWTLYPHIRMLEVKQLTVGGMEECLQVHLSSSALPRWLQICPVQPTWYGKKMNHVGASTQVNKGVPAEGSGFRFAEQASAAARTPVRSTTRRSWEIKSITGDEVDEYSHAAI